MGAIVCRARRITDEMFLVAAQTLAAQVTEADLAQGSLYPPLNAIRGVSAHIAAAVAGVAYRQGLAGTPEPPDILAAVKKAMYEPDYATYAA
jgi:malate dehydrogenase (oxaloacetate-decarboxylating)(NADP+)